MNSSSPSPRSFKAICLKLANTLFSSSLMASVTLPPFVRACNSSCVIWRYRHLPELQLSSHLVYSCLNSQTFFWQIPPKKFAHMPPRRRRFIWCLLLRRLVFVMLPGSEKKKLSKYCLYWLFLYGLKWKHPHKKRFKVDCEMEHYKGCECRYNVNIIQDILGSTTFVKPIYLHKAIVSILKQISGGKYIP